MRVFPHVDLLRALAALLVVVYHLEALGSLALRGDVFWTLPFRYGWVGVDLFLVISGFVIMLSAARAYERAPQDFKWPFMQRRLRRLLPLYVLTCLIFLFLVRPEVLLRPIEQLVPVLLSHALFLQNLSHHTHGVINGVTWSLALEMQFYLALVFTVGFGCVWAQSGPCCFWWVWLGRGGMEPLFFGCRVWPCRICRWSTPPNCRVRWMLLAWAWRWRCSCTKPRDHCRRGCAHRH